MNYKEDQNIEFKQNWRDENLKAIAAFANCQGGKLFIGMNDTGKPVEVRNHLSIPRNPLLAEIFYLAGFIESWGRGTIKIVENCIKHGLPEPDFIEE